MSDDIDHKSGENVRDVLQSRHPESRSVLLSDVSEYDALPKTLKILKSGHFCSPCHAD